MYGVGICDLGRRDDVRDFQLGFAARCRANTNRFIGKPYMKAFLIRFGIHRNRFYAHFLAGSYDP
jgi:hypothetical protein